MPVTTTYPDGETLAIEYDNQGKPLTMANTNAFTYVRDVLYDEAGRMTGLGLGISTSLTTSLFIAGTTTAAWSTTAMAWLFTSLSPSSQSATLSRGVKAAQELLSESRESVRSPGKVWENSGNNEDAIQWFNRISNPDTIEPHPNPNIPGGLQANIFGSDGRVFYRPFSSSLPKVPTIDLHNVPGFNIFTEIKFLDRFY